MSSTSTLPDFPYKVTISLPLPTSRLASSALRALEVDAELSPHVRRDLAVSSADPKTAAPDDETSKSVLEITYRATTNRMLRVAVNGCMESLGVVLGVMEELDVDVLDSGDAGEDEGDEKEEFK